MNTRLSRLFLAGGQNAVPLSGWFLAGWTPGTTLVLFWFENLALSLFLAARIAAHWTATRKRGHTNGFLRTFVLTSLAFTLAHGVFLFLVLGFLLEGTVSRQDAIAGLQWMLAAQVASLAFDLWNIGDWPFAEVRARTDWMMGRVVMVHLSIVFGMFLFMWLEQPWWFFSIFVGLKAMMDIGSLVPQWQPKEPPVWLVRIMDRIGPAPGVAKKKGGLAGTRKEDETFSEYWHRTQAEEAKTFARDEEVMEGA
jgi:Family of unknown function (DUF6498)